MKETLIGVRELAGMLGLAEKTARDYAAPWSQRTSAVARFVRAAKVSVAGPGRPPLVWRLADVEAWLAMSDGEREAWLDRQERRQ